MRLMAELFAADLMVCITRDPTDSNQRFVKVLKNRYTGQHGKVDPNIVIDTCSNMIATSIFGNRLKLFKVELEEAIKKTIMEKIGDAHDPFHRQSSRNGIGSN